VKLDAALRELRAPGEAESLDRARGPLRRAFLERERVPAPARRPWKLVVGVSLIVLLAAALSPPGMAVLDSLRDAVGRDRVVSQPVLTRLPAKGRLLVMSSNGPWIVNAEGAKRRLGDYDDASWSPHGLFVVATRGRELLALTPRGDVRWTVPSLASVRHPRWAPSGFRIAYLSGLTLRVVVGNGTGDRLLAHDVADIAPAWRPGTRHVLAFVGGDGRVRVVDTDRGTTSFTSRPIVDPVALAWTANGSLAILDRTQLRLVRHGRISTPLGKLGNRQYISIDPAPIGDRLALVTFDEIQKLSELFVVRPHGARRIFASVGPFGKTAWSPDSRWILLAWKRDDQWLFLGSERRKRVVPLSGVDRQFTSGTARSGSVPQPLGWCCAPSGSAG
jgi:hypothetical protein